ncbi:GDP-mannose transporter [Paramyrothecium foliicola]|nr:GDP-mannose transporter [Paramyrothecium foliicola]
MSSSIGGIGSGAATASLSKISESPTASILGYCIASISMTVVNKFVVSGDKWNLNFFYLGVQRTRSICRYALTRLAGFPVSLLLVGMIYTGNMALRFLSVPVYTIFKNLTIIVIAYGEVLWFGGSVKPLALGSFGLMVLSSMVAAWADIQYAISAPADDPSRPSLTALTSGFMWMFINVFCSAAYLLSIRKFTKMTNFSNWDIMFYNNLLTVPVLSLASLLLEDWSIQNLRNNFPPESRYSLPIGMVYSGLGALGIAYCTAWCVRATSSTTYAMVGALNKLPLAICGIIFFASPVTFGSVSAIALGFISGLVYTVAKTKETKKPEPEIPLTNLPPRTVEAEAQDKPHEEITSLQTLRSYSFEVVMDPRRDEAIYNERHVKVICVGAGASGLCLAYKLQRSFRSFSLKIYEKNSGVGGTWFENRYPGCACDVPSHNYVFSFEPKADFTSVYAGSEEIQQYFEDFVQKYDLNKYLRLCHLVEETTWHEDKGQWEVVTKNLLTGEATSDWCHILIHACGYLNKPAWPKIPGIDDYEGIKVHSANYDTSISLENQDVLLIGAGSSAVQILPAIQPIVKSVTIFIRSPTWMLPDISTESGKIPPEEIDKLVKNPESLLELRQNNERTMNSIFSLYLKGTVLQDLCRDLLESEMRKIFNGDKEAEEKLIPNFAVGCKRVVPSGFRYLRALRKENVRIVYSGVQSITSSAAVSEEGHAYPGDVMICATGFDTSYVPRYPIYGREGRNLQTEWAESIMGYMGVGISEFPNTFTFLGPYTPVSNGPTLIAIEAQADYICSLIDRYQTEPIHSIATKKAACIDFKVHVASFMDKSVWTDNCRNSHNNHKIGGRVPTTWPGSTLHYLEALREPRWDDWEITYTGNRFSWLGNGISQTEWDSTADLGYYIKQRDDAAWNSRWKRTKAVNQSGTMPPRQLHRQAKLALQQAPEELQRQEGEAAGQMMGVKS